MDILWWDAFKMLHLDLDNLKPFQGSLVRFLGELVEVKGYVTLQTTFGSEENTKRIKVMCLVIDAHSFV